MHELFFKLDDAIKTVLTAAIVSASLDVQVYTGTDDAKQFELPCVVAVSLSMTEEAVKTEYYNVVTLIDLQLAPSDYRDSTAEIITLRDTILNTLRAPTIETDLMTAESGIHIDLLNVNNWQRDVSEDTWHWTLTLNIYGRLS